MTGGAGEAQPSIGDYGLIGDMRTAALVDRRGGLDWLCWPRFDSPPVFRRLIDPDGAMSWQVAPSDPFHSSRCYIPETNILETTFACADGTAVAHDFMVVPAAERYGSQLVRIVQATSGSVALAASLRASSGFGRATASLSAHDDGAVIAVEEGPGPVMMATHRLEVTRDEATLAVVVRPGRPLVMILTARPPDRELTEHAFAARDATRDAWRRWIGGCTLPTVKRDAVVRSALALKLLQHEPTSALVAAPTTSLPEHIGGARNWDYRYVWLRDSAMAILALQRLGQHDEAMAYWEWLAEVARRHGDELSIAYTLDGGPVPAEREVALPGHRRSRPVRVGNAASGQRQHDVYGHVLAAAAHCYHHMQMDVAAPQAVLRRVADLAAERWDRRDDSIWELRDGRAHHTYSRLMCWLALDCAVDLARHGALDGDAANWAAQRDRVRRELLDRAWNDRLGAFTATIAGDQLDASALVAPLIGFLPADDARCRATREAVAAGLGDNGLLRRYRHDDGLGDPDGAFLLCTLWLADNHTLDGDPQRGEELLDRVLATGNDLGLLAEEADPASREPLGNFPQGLTHLGVIQSAIRLDGRS